MFFLARKNLFQEKTRLIISIGGVAFSVLLIILLQGLSIGFSNVLGQYFDTVPADLWVARANTGNMMDPSFLRFSLGPQLKGLDGVADAQPFGMQSLTSKVNGKDLAFYLISYDPASGVGKPTTVSSGKTTPKAGEIIIDRIVAKSNNIKIGDTLPYATRQLKVVGLSEGTFILSSSFAFVNEADASKIYGLPATTNYWLVQLDQGADSEKVRTAINQNFPGAKAVTKAQFVQKNVNVLKDVVQPVFGMLVLLGALIGTAVIGLTIFIATIEKSKEYGVLKAIGLKNSQLYAIVLEQALIAAIIGFAVGAVLAYGLNTLITNAVPQFLTKIRIFDIAWIFAVVIGMAIVSSYIPIRRMSKIDPAEVFRS